MESKKVLLAEPLIKNPIKKQKNGKVADIGMRLGLAYLAGFLIDNCGKYDIIIKNYRFEEFLGNQRDLVHDLIGIDYLGITASSSEYPDALKMAKQAKAMGCIVIMGGIYPSSNPKEVLNTGYVDYIIAGEGEHAFLSLLNALSEQKLVNRIWTTGKNELIQNLDVLRPAYELLPMNEYCKYIAAPIYSSRGCSGQCDFCTLNQHWLNTHRCRSVDNVLREIRTLKEFGFTRINFKDESLTLDKNHAKQLFKALAQENFELNFKCKTRIDGIDKELLNIMKDANFEEIHFGIETLDDSTLELLHKNISKDEIIKKMELMLTMGFTINPSIILGNPGDTKESLKELADFIKNLYFTNPNKVKVYTCINTPHPGSVQYKKAKQKGITIIDSDLNNYTNFCLVSVPSSLGSTEQAIKIIAETQRDIVSSVNGPEPLININNFIK
jgi:anaerobic magnesium-protoporphyrin IX monomethyl ester cyclase